MTLEALEAYNSLAATQVRLAELRSRRLEPSESEALKTILTTSSDPPPGFLVATEKEAVSLREKTIRAVVDRHGAEALSISLTLATLSDDLPIVRGDVHLTVSQEGIGPLLQALETGPPAVSFHHLRLSYKLDQEPADERQMLDRTASLMVYRENSVTERAVR
jgi:hypothetical protein